MSPEIKVAVSREIPKGACVVGKERRGGKYEPIAISDSTATDLFINGIVRRELERGEDVIILFNSEDEMMENHEHIANAFGDLLGNDE
jgi:hypothetical protein